MSVRAKFLCHSTTAYAPSNGSVQIGVVLFPVFGNGNASWSEATPHGKVELTVTTPEAAAAFVAGRHYWLDFTPIAVAAEQELASSGEKPARFAAVSSDAGNLLTIGTDGLPYLSAAAIGSAERDYPNEIQVGDVIDPVPEAGHDGPQYVTAVTQHPDGTALDLRPATPEEIAAQPATGTYTSSPSAPTPPSA